MKNKCLIIPKKKNDLDEININFLLPLKGFCVGHKFEVTFEEIKNASYILINRLLDKEGIEKLESLFFKNKEKIKGVVFEDLGVLEIIKKLNSNIETIYYPAHTMCSIHTVNACLEYIDTLILSPDITKEEIEEILKLAKKEICLMIYGPLPYLYSRRTLLTNYQKVNQLPNQKEETLYEKTTNKQFYFVENEYGTVCYDKKNFDGRELLQKENVKYYILDVQHTEYENITKWLNLFFESKPLPNTTTGFLYQKTIYRLLPRKE